MRNDGAFIAVVGPSGAGKDTLIDSARAALAGDPRYLFVRRVVTRASGAHEDHDSVGEDEFARLEAGGAFALSWRAHGLAYGVPAAAVSAVDNGLLAVCNLSRTAIGDARRRFSRVITVLVTAPDDMIAARMVARGRDSAEEAERRIKRERNLDRTIADHLVSNDGTREEGGRRFLACLEGLTAIAARW
jgi:ribose 1,5-bisphosphokinase